MSQATPSLWQRWFPPAPNFLGIIDNQLGHARQALEAFTRWSATPGPPGVEEIFQIETDADQVRRELVTALASAFDTPLDREDLDDFSQRIDDIVDGVRNLVREATALAVIPDDAMGQMVGHLQDALTDLQNALHCLPKDLHGALTNSAKSRHALRLNERIYTEALARLLQSDDFRFILRQREAYRLMVHLSEQVERAGEELDHAVNKLG